MPFTRIELVVLSVDDGVLQVLLGKREQAPYAGKWALPGGVLRIDLDSDLAAGAQRVARERLGCELPNLRQVVTVGSEGRDPRSPWALSVVYASLVFPDTVLLPGKRIEALQWRRVSDEFQWARLAFDHGELVRCAVGFVREEVAGLRFPAGWLPEVFTIPQLQVFSEAVLGQRLNKVTFRRRLEAAQMLEAVEGEFRLQGAHRPAQAYRFRVRS